MRIKKGWESNIDTGIYLLACIASLGLIYVARVILTKAIKEAFEDETIKIKS